MSTATFKVDPGITTDTLVDSITLNATPGIVGYMELVGNNGATTYYPAQVDSSGRVQIAGALTSALPAGSAVIGHVIVDSVAGTVTVSGSVTVAGTVTANAGTGTMAVSAAALPLPTGASSSANQTTGNTSLSNIDGHIIKADTDHVAVSVALPAGAALIGKVGIDQTTPGTTNKVSIGTDGVVDTELPTAAALADATANPTTPVIGSLNEVYNGATWDRLRGTTTGGAWTNNKQLNDVAIHTDNGTVGAGTQRVTLATASTSTITKVTGSITNATLIAANTARVSLVIYNDSTSDCYVKYGATATNDDFTVLLPAGGTVNEKEYNGRIDGIWVSANGKARVTEITK